MSVEHSLPPIQPWSQSKIPPRPSSGPSSQAQLAGGPVGPLQEAAEGATSASKGAVGRAWHPSAATRT